MTLAPHRPPHQRFLVVVAVGVLLLLLGIAVLLAFSAGASVFLFALAGVAAVDAVLLWRTPKPPPAPPDA